MVLLIIITRRREVLGRFNYFMYMIFIVEDTYTYKFLYDILGISYMSIEHNSMIPPHCPA